MTRYIYSVEPTTEGIKSGKWTWESITKQIIVAKTRKDARLCASFHTGSETRLDKGGNPWLDKTMVSVVKVGFYIEGSDDQPDHPKVKDAFKLS